MERDRDNNLIIRARRRIQEETLDLGDRFIIYFHRINNLCPEILNA